MLRKHLIRGAVGFSSLYVLYKSIPVSMAGAVVFVLFGILDKKEHKKARDADLTDRFLDFLICLEPVLNSSGAFPGLFAEAAADYRGIHGGDSMCKYLEDAVKGFRMNNATSDVLYEMACGIDIEDAHMFAASISACERNGGNLVEITRRTTGILSGKIHIKRNIEVMISGRRFEQKVITAMPIALVMVFSVTAGSYLAPLYSSFAGRLAMSAAGLMFLAQWYFCKRIAEIGI
ncbi:MAG: hypothetical protein JXB33_07235 [Clostridia bacterium]|nr:hypothetical protein [Clostridia bacterium]